MCWELFLCEAGSWTMLVFHLFFHGMLLLDQVLYLSLELSQLSVIQISPG